MEIKGVRMGGSEVERREDMKLLVDSINNFKSDIKKEIGIISRGQIETNDKVNFIHNKLFISNGAPGLIKQFFDNDKDLAEELVKTQKEIKELEEKRFKPIIKSIGKVKTKVNKILMFFAAIVSLIVLTGTIIGIVSALT